MNYREITVQEGDTLGHIAERECGRFSLWPAIYCGNEDTIRREQMKRDVTKLGPDWIYPGMKLMVPVRQPATVPVPNPSSP